MEKFKKSAAGHAAIWLLLSGELEIKDSDLNARTVEYSSPVTIQGSDLLLIIRAKLSGDG
jgi:hypothetical protein